MRTTAASSPVSAETSTSCGVAGIESEPRTSSRSDGPSLHPQPAPWLKLVRGRSSCMQRGYGYRVRTAVVGHTEWIEFGRVERVPAPGDIVHASGEWEEPGGGGAGAAGPLARLAGPGTVFTAPGADRVAPITR